MATSIFKGFKQSTLSAYNALSNDEKKGYMWLVRDLSDTGNTKSAIYFGTRLYAEQNYSDKDLDDVLSSLKTSFGGLLDENGDFVGFPYTGSTTSEDHPILTQDAKNVLEVLQNLETAILANSAKTETNAENIKTNADEIDSIESLISALTETLATKANIDDVYTQKEIDDKIDDINGKLSGVWHFKGTKDTLEELEALTGASSGDVWQVGEKEYAFNGEKWVELGFNIDLSNYATKDYVNDTVDTLGNEVDSAITEVKESVEELSDSVENLETKATASVGTMDEATAMAKAENAGQIIYISNTEGDTGYTAGAYIVTGNGSVAKIGTTTATGDLSGAVTALEGKVSTLQSEVETTTTGLLDRVEALENDTHTTIDGDDTEE